MTSYMISIVMAIYKPNIKWLCEQLDSLDSQSYPHLELLVWNDCPDDKTDYEKILEKHITNFPFKIFKGEANLGSSGAFGQLTRLASGGYIAYCDQDDIWLPEKLSALAESIDGGCLICSDMYVINEDDEVVATSIRKVRPRHVFYEGSDLFRYLVNRNFVTGCTALAEARFAKTCLPFPKHYVHDQWLALNAAAEGGLRILSRPLIKYRIHGNNQTAVLAGVNTKEDYYRIRIVGLLNQTEEIIERFPDEKRQADILFMRKWAKARQEYYLRHSFGNLKRLYSFRKLNRSTVLFEMALPVLPSFVFKYLIRKIREGKL